MRDKDKAITVRFRKEKCHMEEFLKRLQRGGKEVDHSKVVMLSCPCSRCTKGTM